MTAICPSLVYEFLACEFDTCVNIVPAARQREVSRRHMERSGVLGAPLFVYYLYAWL